MSARFRGSYPPTTPAASAVFSVVLTHGPVSRVDIARLTGLSSAAVTKAARPFIVAGYLEELGTSAGPSVGRPPNPLAIRGDREFFTGVKITDDEVIGVVTDLRAEVLASTRRPLTTHTVDGVVAELAGVVTDLLATSPAFRQRCHSLGLAMSGDVDRSAGLIRYSPFLGWRKVPLVELASTATGLDVTVENDVRSLTVAEQWFGEGIGASSFAVVSLGIGIGCGLVIDDRIVAGARGVAGEIGHVSVGGDGPLCHCGGRGCVEAIAGSAAIVEAVRAATGDPALDVTGAIAVAHAGDPAARAVFARAGRAIGLGMAAMANVVGPERIIITGDLAGLAAYDLFEQGIRETFTVQAFGAAADCKLIFRPLPFEHWARGAAAVSIERLFTARDR
jgi:predicted NBD/HSP70 family sugar kinase